MSTQKYDSYKFKPYPDLYFPTLEQTQGQSGSSPEV